MSFDAGESARARGNQIRHRPLMLQQGRLGKNAALSDQRRESAFSVNAAIPNRGARLP